MHVVTLIVMASALNPLINGRMEKYIVFIHTTEYYIAMKMKVFSYMTQGDEA